MPYSKRMPPIKIKLNIEEFNKLCEILNTMSSCKIEGLERKSSKLKDKLLRYSVPYTNENGQIIIDIRFFNDEITNLFYVLFFGIENIIQVDTNYYDVLVQVREKLKAKNQVED